MLGVIILASETIAYVTVIGGIELHPHSLTSWYSTTMLTEETPLLEEQQNHNTVYDRFSRSRKRVIVAVVSWAGLLPCKHTKRYLFIVLYSPECLL